MPQHLSLQQAGETELALHTYLGKKGLRPVALKKKWQF
jgi:hypothetical protein